MKHLLLFILILTFSYSSSLGIVLKKEQTEAAEKFLFH